MADRYDFTANVTTSGSGSGSTAGFSVTQTNVSLGSSVSANVIGGGSGPMGYTPVKGVDYSDGKEVELQRTATHLQWRYTGESWTDLLLLSDLDGTDGKEVELQTTATHIQWRLTGEAWTNLVALSSLKGDKGDAGADSTVPGPANTLSIGSVTEGAAAASITGAAPTQTLNLTLPRGNAGVDGYNPMTVSATPPLGASIGDLWYQP